MSNIFQLFFLFLFSYNCVAQIVIEDAIYSQSEEEICTSIFQLAVEKELHQKPINEIILTIAKNFIGTDYAANTLEIGKNEKLVVFLTGLDCYTFLESSLVFARSIQTSRTTFEDYLRELENIRYRNGKLIEYPSRLHYFSDWIYEMDKRGIGKDISKEIGGIPYKKKIDFMSSHVDSYKRLKDNPHFVQEIAKQEKEISSRKYYYIPQEKIASKEKKIQDGDIIGITTNIDGLDISHTGIAVRMSSGRIHLLHAPNVGYKVQITEKPLADYIKGNKKQTGIMVLRPL